MHFHNAWLMSLLSLLFTAPLWSQSAAPWDAARRANPPGVSSSLRLLDAGPFPAGSVLRAEFRFDPGGTTPPGEPSPVSWSRHGFLLDPAGAFPKNRSHPCGTIEEPCGNRYARSLHAPREGPIVYLADQLPPLAPGRYRVAMLMLQSVRSQSAGGPPVYGFGNPRVYAVSNTVELEIIPATEEWIRETVDAALRILDDTELSRNPEGREARERAAKQIAHIDDPYAWNAAISRIAPYRSDQSEESLLRSTRHADLCSLLQRRLRDPAQTVNYSFLNALETNCTLMQVESPPYVVSNPHGRPPSSGELAAREYWRRRNEISAGIRERALEALSGTLASRGGESWLTSLSLLIEQARGLRSASPTRSAPSWFASVQKEFARGYPSVDLDERWRLLTEFVNVSPAGAWTQVVLEGEMASWKPGGFRALPNAAFRFLASLDPVRAREIIASELEKPTTWMEARALEYLPPAEASFSDEQLLDALQLARENGGSAEALRAAAIARYASPAVSSRVRQLYIEGGSRCQPELLAYLIHADPNFAALVIRDHERDMEKEPPSCWKSIVQETPKLANSPVLEEYVSAYLMHREVWVKRTAAEALSAHGTSKARESLLAALRQFHEDWNGRRQELEKTPLVMEFESHLASAILNGQQWFSDEAEIRAVQQLCISAYCKQIVASLLASAAKAPLPIVLQYSVDGFTGWFAQYGYRTEATPDRILEKLSQFPQGTAVHLKLEGLQGSEWERKIRAAVTKMGFTVLPQ